MSWSEFAVYMTVIGVIVSGALGAFYYFDGWGD
jgi:hypothetical protein